MYYTKEPHLCSYIRLIILYKKHVESIVYAALPLPENSGLILRNAEFFIDWEDPEEQALISQNVSNMKNGCKCIRQGVLMQGADARKVIPFVVLVATASTAQTAISDSNEDSNEDASESESEYSEVEDIFSSN